MRFIVTTLFALATFLPPEAVQPLAEFRWSGAIASGKTLEIHGVNGDIRTELTPGAQVEVRATKRARRSDPATVTIETAQENGNVTFCTVYPADTAGWRRGPHEHAKAPNACRVGENERIDSHNNDVVVDFVVRIPAGVRFVGQTVNGSVDARGLKSDAEVRTVNGRIDLGTSGTGSARTVNGSIDAAIGSANWTGTLDFNSVNGNITLRLPKDTSTNLRAETMNGRVDSDFPVSVQSFRGRSRRVVGVIGKGGRDLDLETLNGSIRLQLVPD